MKLLKSLYEIHSPSKNESVLANFVKEELIKAGCSSEVDSNGNVLAVKGNISEGEGYPCIVAHIDEVHNSGVTHVITIGNTIFGWNQKAHEQNGIGADDKNGIWCAISAAKKYDKIKIALFVGEEIGCVGSHAVNMDFFKDVNFVLEADRKNSNDFITSISSIPLCNDEFVKDMDLEKFGYKVTSGLSTDVCALKTRKLNVSCCNISCGYYNPHTKAEYTEFNELQNCFNMICNFIDNHGSTKYTHIYEKPEIKTYGNGKTYNNNYNYDDLDYWGSGDMYNRNYSHYNRSQNTYKPVYWSDSFSNLMENMEGLFDNQEADEASFSIHDYYVENKSKYSCLSESDFVLAFVMCLNNIQMCF